MLSGVGTAYRSLIRAYREDFFRKLISVHCTFIRDLRVLSLLTMFQNQSLHHLKWLRCFQDKCSGCSTSVAQLFVAKYCTLILRFLCKSSKLGKLEKYLLFWCNLSSEMFWIMQNMYEIMIYQPSLNENWIKEVCKLPIFSNRDLQGGNLKISSNFKPP